MEAMTQRSVDGAVYLEYAPAGLTWRLTCPAANALEPGEREQGSGEGKKINRQRTRFVPASTEIFAKT
jgi:hypothetical protein